ncbi:GAF domain-containing sensor histidine kinase [Aureibacillus halotolerans]|uniref:histidine kinase n=1 Tax=Aureibacillus halotolerans TaxID=1508390 RepID=A0A4R6UA92_9BACI|nr:GAF domain-containing sensor histidine kinase [Aureibacillus halotolerans]TDQ42772.1 hypothetical protein EV213_101201 [Aureibacillus halotolerans]
MDHLAMLKEIAKTLSTGTKLDNMLLAALKRLLDITGLQSGWVFFISKDGTHSLITEHGAPPALVNNDCRRLKEGGCWCKSQFLKGKLQKAVNILECQRLERAIEANDGLTNDTTHHATIPLMAGNEAVGLINVASPGKQHFAKEELELLETVAFQMGTSIKRFQLLEESYERQELLDKTSEFTGVLHRPNGPRTVQHVVEQMQLTYGWTFVSLTIDNQGFEVGSRQGKQFNAETSVDTQLSSLWLQIQNKTKVPQDVLETVMLHISVYVERIALEEEQQQLTRETERHRLAQELHDSVNQLLFSISLHTKGLSRGVPEGQLKDGLHHIQHVTEHALKQLKHLVSHRELPDIDDSLPDAIIHYGRLLQLDISVDIDPIISLSPSCLETVFRFIQEALNNARKHSTSEQVTVTMSKNNDQVTLQIRDNGNGVDVAELVEGFGVRHMRTRAAELQGTAKMTSDSDTGTTWTLVFPESEEPI